MSTALISSFYDFGDHINYRTSNNSATSSMSINAHKSNSSSLHFRSNANANSNSNSLLNHPLERKNIFPGAINVQVNSNGCLPLALSCVNNNSNPLAVRRIVTSSGNSVASSSPLSSPSSSPTSASVISMQQKVSQPAMSPSGHQTNGSHNHNGLTHSVSVNNHVTSGLSSKEHKKLDRSLSEPMEKSLSSSPTNGRPNQANSSRYKTELCRPFEENGTCKYGDKCQFAHGAHELRNLQRHPKYKTELCRTFHTTGFCPYGPRCHFIHNSEESKKSVMTTLQAGFPAGSSRSGSSGGRKSPSGNNGHNSNNNNCSGKGNNCSNQMVAVINGINSAAMKAPTYSNPQPMRPKALSIGSYSLGSSGDLSPPSSQSGSPTSLSSFFTEEPQFPGFTPTPTHSASSSSGNTAFSFSPDFRSLIGPNCAQNALDSNQVNNHMNNNRSNNHVNNINKINSSNSHNIGSNNGLAPSYSKCSEMRYQEMDTNSTRPAPALFPISSSSMLIETGTESGSHSGSASGSDQGSGSQGSGASSPPPVLYPAAPSSPVDSLGSELEMLSLGEGSSPVPPCSSPSEVTGNLPRLPIFTRFANIGNNGFNDSD